jgi:hypothetical protein
MEHAVSSLGRQAAIRTHRQRRALLFVLLAAAAGASLVCLWRSRSSAAPLASEDIVKMVAYDLEGLEGGALTAQQLEAITSAEVGAQEARSMFGECSYHAGSPVWKGSRLAIVSLKNGTERRLAVSYYGGFFMVLGQEGYYTCDGESKKNLLRFLDGILRERFIPQRMHLKTPPATVAQ